MSRKRKLYVSEFLKHNKNRLIEVCISLGNNEHAIKFDNVNSALYSVEDHEKNTGETLEIKEWYYSEYNGFVIFTTK